jgi:hypothetical protein
MQFALFLTAFVAAVTVEALREALRQSRSVYANLASNCRPKITSEPSER